MTIEEMITDFTEQQSKVRAEIADIKDALKAREEQNLRLAGAIEGLRLASQDNTSADESATREAEGKPAVKVK